MTNIMRDMNFTRKDHDVFSGCPNVSIDYAVMERTADAIMVY